MAEASILHPQQGVEPHWIRIPSPPALLPRYPILLVDDDPSFRLGLAGVLGDDGHEVFAYAFPARSPRTVRLRGVTLLITDYDMPGENGIAFADRFHAARPDVPVVLVTAYRTHAIEALARHVRSSPPSRNRSTTSLSTS